MYSRSVSSFCSASGTRRVSVVTNPMMSWMRKGPSWPWSLCNWIYNYLCNEYLSPPMLLVRISIRARCTILCDKDYQWLATGRWFSPGPPVPSNKNWSRRYSWQIVKSDIKHHQTNNQTWTRKGPWVLTTSETLWHRYSLTACQVIVATVKLSNWFLQ